MRLHDGASLRPQGWSTPRPHLRSPPTSKDPSCTGHPRTAAPSVPKTDPDKLNRPESVSVAAHPVLGDDHPDTLISVGNLALNLRGWGSMRQPAGSTRTLRAAVAGSLRAEADTYGPDPQRTKKGIPVCIRDVFRIAR